MCVCVCVCARASATNLHVNEQVLGLQVSMEHPVLVTICNPLQQLVQERFDGVLVNSSVAAGVKVVFQVLIEVPEIKVEI